MSPKIFLDSGAFSAFTKGVEIELESYVQFIKDNLEYIEVYANLDVIGDEEATYNNWLKMKELGLDPVPVFHQGEDFKYLERYIEQCDLIALGGMVGITSNHLKQWLDICFSKYICNSEGYPKVKVHGFGVTSFSLLWRYPWYSVDSTTWIMTSRMGGVIVPRKGIKGYDYTKRPLVVKVSNRSQSRASNFLDWKNMPPTQQTHVREYLDEEFGIDIGKSKFKVVDAKSYNLKENEKWFDKEDEYGRRTVEIVVRRGVSNDYLLRDITNIFYYQNLQKAIPSYPRRFKKRKGLFL